MFKTLRYVASLAAGTEIVFQYFVPVELCNDEDRPIVTLWQARRTAQGEPGGASVEPVRADYFGNTRAGARIHAGVGPRTRGS